MPTPVASSGMILLASEAALSTLVDGQHVGASTTSTTVPGGTTEEVIPISSAKEEGNKVEEEFDDPADLTFRETSKEDSPSRANRSPGEEDKGEEEGDEGDDASTHGETSSQEEEPSAHEEVPAQQGEALTLEEKLVHDEAPT
ncbi:uncharacterized protein LOC109838994 [Asparagus officinalis]|uniref:uncharacterized protein LOC109838994 n=1 Tax=Asparagus officinalis TaxID=4686 RepID=UPI00098E05BC|nr:uncharacterized protein LOC109838994 [Asparagus officinalis]